MAQETPHRRKRKFPSRIPEALNERILERIRGWKQKGYGTPTYAPCGQLFLKVVAFVCVVCMCVRQDRAC